MKNKLLHDTGSMGVGGNRCRVIVWKTTKSIIIAYSSLYTDDIDSVSYYKDGSYPPYPDNPNEIINDYNTTNFDCWYEHMKQITPYRTLT